MQRGMLLLLRLLEQLDELQLLLIAYHVHGFEPGWDSLQTKFLLLLEKASEWLIAQWVCRFCFLHLQ